MALKSTIYKAELDVADLDRNYYAAHELTLARHPSESESRMMIGLAAFALNAHERLEFSRGLGEIEEPDLWQHDLTGDLELWIELGRPDAKRLAKACGRSKAVVVYAYTASSEQWWEPIAEGLARFRNLSVYRFDPEETLGLESLVRRSMKLSCMIQDGEAWLRDDEGGEVHLAIAKLK